MRVKRSHLSEVIAALLGYRSYAALMVEEADATKVLHLGEYDPGGDRMFNGDKLHCLGWLHYLKAGRAGLVFSESGAGATSDDSWRDDEDYGDLSVPPDNSDSLA